VREGGGGTKGRVRGRARRSSVLSGVPGSAGIGGPGAHRGRPAPGERFRGAGRRGRQMGAAAREGSGEYARWKGGRRAYRGKRKEGRAWTRVCRRGRAPAGSASAQTRRANALRSRTPGGGGVGRQEGHVRPWVAARGRGREAPHEGKDQAGRAQGKRPAGSGGEAPRRVVL